MSSHFSLVFFRLKASQALNLAFTTEYFKVIVHRNFYYISRDEKWALPVSRGLNLFTLPCLLKADNVPKYPFITTDSLISRTC